MGVSASARTTRKENGGTLDAELFHKAIWKIGFKSFIYIMTL